MIWYATHEKSPYAICGQHRPWSACAYAQADLDLRCPLTDSESIDIVVYVNEQRMSRSECTDAHAHLDIRCSHRHKGLFPTLCNMLNYGVQILRIALVYCISSSLFRVDWLQSFLFYIYFSLSLLMILFNPTSSYLWLNKPFFLAKGLK